jgi:gamma-glutamyl-gamma-aminobutyrate hydrolase PuuD
MNIKLVWPFDTECYQTLFPELTLFDWNEDNSEKIDLLVFPGGEDVSLEYYCSRDTIAQFGNLCYTNKKRDDYEINVLEACYDGRLNVNKILGVCRGLQFLNVMFDGKLFIDLPSMGLGHDNIHSITHKIPSKLGFLEKVNSLHHQGLRTIGSYDRKGNRNHPVIIATDKTGNVPEIAMWGSGRVLGVQFHPEYFWNDNPDKIKFRDVVYSWIKGESIV